MVTYNKKGVAKKGERILSSGGPRDRQRKLASQNNMKDLLTMKEDLFGITTDMTTKDVGYSKDQVKQLVNDSLEELSIDLETKYITEINDLKKELVIKSELIDEFKRTVIKLEDKLDTRDVTILELSTKLASIPRTVIYSDGVEEQSDPDRPSIDKVFIDPTEKGSEDRYETHIKVVEEVSSKPNVTSDVNKLKELMGNKLPKI